MESTIITTIGLIVVAIISYFGGKKSNKAQAQNLDADTITKLSKQVNGLVDDQAKLRQDLEDYQTKIDEKDNQLKEFKLEVRTYFAELKHWFESKGITDYPQPPENLINTKPKMKRVK